jgi:Tfp pilus assembly protein PilF
MYPVLILLILCAALTIQHVINWTVARETSQQKFLVAGFSLLMVLLLIPNFIWGRNFISTALAYRSAPENLFVSTASFDQYPAEYTKGIREACNWISAQDTNGMRVISRYQQAGLWLGEGEVIVFGPLVAPGVFDDVARYYNAGYVLALSQKNQMRDFEYQMASSTRFWFETVYRRGDAEVLRIHRAPSANTVPGSMDSDSSGAQRTRFLRAMREMGKGNYTSARGGFEQLTESPGFAAPATFYSAIAAEFSGDMPGARKLLLHLGTFPQAGPYLVQTRVHQDIIAFLDSARTARSPADKAWYYHSVSVSYWMMGFRRQAEEVLARCVASDPSYFLGPMFSILYLLQRNDIATARLYYSRAEALRPGDTLVATLRNLIALTDSARTAPSPRTGSRFRTELGSNYQFLGLNDFAADQFATAVELDSANTTALHHLADIHILKKRYYPAALTLSAWVQREPSNATAQEKLRAIMARLR